MAIQSFDFYVNNTPAPAPHGLVRFLWDDVTRKITSVHVEVGGDGAVMRVHIVDPAANPPINFTQQFPANADGSLKTTDFNSLPPNLTQFYTLTTTQKGTVGFDLTSSTMSLDVTLGVG